MSEDINQAEERSPRSRFVRRAAPFLLLILVLLCVGLYFGARAIRARPDQPIDYSHREHLENGIQCLYCHTEPMRSQIASIPSVAKCMGCHSVIATESEEIQTLTEYWESGEPVPWQRLNDQPDFVYFSHQPHILSGMNCETCHGEVAEMDRAEEVVRMDMGWCLDCHEQQPPEKVPRLLDCLTCHK